ncbi:MAG: FKBP-type peptidyl-prolyl cis-trans isomerase [Bdellovibrionaceae bacterium]|nr:FKBP-type peptidyl-prolyl cis-trans isomerase [Pseudobdellovibrionaceae bacterium]
MKVIIVMLLSLGFIACDKKVKMDNDKAKYSYAIGQQIGKNMKGQGIDLDIDAFSLAIAHQLKDQKSLLTEDEMKTALSTMAEDRNKKRREEAEVNKKTGEDFLTKNKSKNGVKVLESGLQYEVVKEGDGKIPTAENVVKVHYKGTLIDGTEFDSSYSRNQPAEFPVTAVIKGWTEALQLMKVGSKWKLYIPPDLAYGEAGRPSIPGNSVLVFEVELLDIIKK